MDERYNGYARAVAVNCKFRLKVSQSDGIIDMQYFSEQLELTRTLAFRARQTIQRRVSEYWNTVQATLHQATQV
jgi:hypothetical protein